MGTGFASDRLDIGGESCYVILRESASEPLHEREVGILCLAMEGMAEVYWLVTFKSLLRTAGGGNPVLKPRWQRMEEGGNRDQLQKMRASLECIIERLNVLRKVASLSNGRNVQRCWNLENCRSRETRAFLLEYLNTSSSGVEGFKNSYT